MCPKVMDDRLRCGLEADEDVGLTLTRAGTEGIPPRTLMGTVWGWGISSMSFLLPLLDPGMAAGLLGSPFVGIGNSKPYISN